MPVLNKDFAVFLQFQLVVTWALPRQRGRHIIGAFGRCVASFRVAGSEGPKVPRAAFLVVNNRWGRKLKTSLELKTYTFSDDGIAHIVLYAVLSLFPFFGVRLTMLASHLGLVCAPVAHDSLSHGYLISQLLFCDGLVNSSLIVFLNAFSRPLKRCGAWL